jgi:hypothetical protein
VCGSNEQLALVYTQCPVHVPEGIRKQMCTFNINERLGLKKKKAHDVSPEVYIHAEALLTVKICEMWIGHTRN